MSCTAIQDTKVISRWTPGKAPQMTMDGDHFGDEELLLPEAFSHCARFIHIIKAASGPERSSLNAPGLKEPRTAGGYIRVVAHKRTELWKEQSGDRYGSPGVGNKHAQQYSPSRKFRLTDDMHTMMAEPCWRPAMDMSPTLEHIEDGSPVTDLVRSA